MGAGASGRVQAGVPRAVRERAAVRVGPAPALLGRLAHGMARGAGQRRESEERQRSWTGGSAWSAEQRRNSFPVENEASARMV